MMKKTRPIEFKEANGTLRGVGDVIDLSVYRDDKEVISCWQIPFWKRVKLLWGGRVWLRIKGKTHAAVYVDTECFE